MKFLNILSPKTIVFLTLSVSLLIASCSNPSESDDSHEHATGAVLLIDGEEVASFREGSVTGTLEVETDETSPLITLYFLDEDGHRFHPDETEYSLDWTEIDTGIAQLHQPEEGGAWSFYVTGISTGETVVQLHMFHTDADHSDFFTPNISITVN